MSYRDKTYVIFDGDNDLWAYKFMKGWKSLDHIDFDFEDAHDEYGLTKRAEDEAYIKIRLRQRFKSAKQVILLIGKSTKNLYRYVRWELEVALELDLPIIAVNLNGDRLQNIDTCPPIIRNKYVVHIPFRMKIIKYALDHFPSSYKNRDLLANTQGGRLYPDSLCRDLGLNDKQ
jgi:hypothetical protein